MNVLLPFAGVIVLLLALMLRSPQRQQRTVTAAETHALTINPTANPYRVGAYVYVMEDSTPTEHDWAGTYIGMSDGMALIRDHETHTIVHVSKDQIYGATR